MVHVIDGVMKVKCTHHCYRMLEKFHITSGQTIQMLYIYIYAIHMLYISD